MLTDEEADAIENAVWNMELTEGFLTALIRAGYDRCAEDCAKACEELDEGLGEITPWAASPDVCRALKHKEE